MNHVSLTVLFVSALPGCVAAPQSSASVESTVRGPRPSTSEVRPLSLQTFTLPNGMTVVLHEDHALPKVVINTWFAVGSKDEARGRSGFAHLFEHLMFMGTARVPGNQYDVLMEKGGGSNNASTSTDRTNYYSTGPSSLLPTLLWLDADRLAALADDMSQAKVDRQCDIVQNERRQGTENVPYGKVELILPPALYPEGHPYHHPVIGSHEDLEAATLEDVVEFFHTYYVPSNATLVVAGDFDPVETRELISRLFGAIPAKPSPPVVDVPAATLRHEKRIVEVDKVEFPKLYLAWHSPPAYAPGDAELELVATILAEGPSSRLERRLVLETGLAQEVDASQDSAELGSVFRIEALATGDGDLEEIEREVQAVLDEFVRDGPTEAELARAKAQREARFLRRMESLFARAEAVNAYHHYFGVADGFQRDLERWMLATKEGVRSSADKTLGPARVDLRILPEGSASSPTALDERPEDLPKKSHALPAPASFELSNGIPVHVFPRHGPRLFSGALLVRGGEALVPLQEAGTAALAARWLESGAGGLNAPSFADAVDSLGASVRANASTGWMRVDVSGLSSRLEETLDLFADLVLRANLQEQDFEREKSLAIAGVRARDENPQLVARDVARVLLFGTNDPRGRPLEGTVESLSALTDEDVERSLRSLLHPSNAAFAFAGDFEPEALVKALEARFGSWRSSRQPERVALEPLVEPPEGRLVLVDRPDAPQTVIQILRPLAASEGVARAARQCADTVFGGTFTSRLNANLREEKGFTYGARSRVSQEGNQHLLSAGASVTRQHTGASLAEFQREFTRMAQEELAPEELQKALESNRQRAIESLETTSAMASALAGLVQDDRPLDSLGADLAALDLVDLAQANQASHAGTYEWSNLLVVLVGDRDDVLPQLAEAGFPAPEEVDTAGVAKP